MTNALYGLAREAFLGGDIDWDADSIRCLLIRTSGGGTGPYYTVNIDTDEFLSDVPNNSDCRPAPAEILGSKTKTLGVADGSDLTFTAVGAGEQIQALVLYQHTGVESTSRLIAYLDSGTGLPTTPTGIDIVVTWSSEATKIFKL